MTYWPGTKIVKSQGNAFTYWKEDRPSLANNRSWRQSVIGQKNASNPNKKQLIFTPSSK